MKPFIVIIGVGLLLASCNSQPGNQSAAVPADSAALRSDTVAEPGSRVADSIVPSALSEAEEFSEDIQDQIAANQWSRAAATADSITSLADTLARTAHAADVAAYRREADSVRTSIERRDRLGALVAANAVSRAVTDMTANYATVIPIDVGYMDVATREAIYAADAGAWDRVNAAAGEIRDRYDAVKAHVSAASPDLAMRIDAHLATLMKDASVKNASGAKAAAGQLGEDVDAIERTYSS